MLLIDPRCVYPEFMEGRKMAAEVARMNRLALGVRFRMSARAVALVFNLSLLAGCVQYRPPIDGPVSRVQLEVSHRVMIDGVPVTNEVFGWFTGVDGLGIPLSERETVVRVTPGLHTLEFSTPGIGPLPFELTESFSAPVRCRLQVIVEGDPLRIVSREVKVEEVNR